jgi:hypothetical protein
VEGPVVHVARLVGDVAVLGDARAAPAPHTTPTTSIKTTSRPHPQPSNFELHLNAHFLSNLHSEPQVLHGMLIRPLLCFFCFLLSQHLPPG